MDFSEALKAIKMGSMVSRLGWDGRNQWLAINLVSNNDPMTSSYIYIKTTEGRLVPWTPTQEDMLADDWMVKVK